MEGGGTGLKRETDVGCLGQRKERLPGREGRREKTEEPGGKKQSHLRGIPEDRRREKENKRKRKEDN